MQNKSKVFPFKTMVDGFPSAHNYPSGTTIRNLVMSSLSKQQLILDTITDQTVVAPWVLVLIARATASITMVEEFLSYYYMGNKNSNALAGDPTNYMETVSKSFAAGQMIRSLLYAAKPKELHILELVQDYTEVPVWIVMKVARFTDDISSVADYLTYAYRKA